MPILDVEIVAEETPIDGLAQRIAEATAPVLGAAPGTLWVKLRRPMPGCYAENGPAPANPYS